MINKLALCAIVLGTLSINVTANAATENFEKEQKTLELIEKAEALNLVSDEDFLIVDGYEIALGDTVSASESISRNSFSIRGNVNVNRPLIGGVMTATATATTTTNRTVHQISARANVNNNGASMSNGVWRRLNNTTFVSTSRSGTSRRGIGHGNHEAKLTSSSNALAVNTTNRQFQ